MLSIGLRYCGGCNPQIDRSRVIRDLKKALSKMDLRVDFITDKERAVDIILLINGCMHACLEEEYLSSGRNLQCISVKGEMVDSQYVEEDHILETLIKKIMGFFNLSGPYSS
ncbi:MAG: hypothetical protein JRI72_08715 [Deltaproteobacteria bacterium]|nr:hypothetical protein [Deltaproteobacteria bacterium]